MADKQGVGTFVNEVHELASDTLDLFSLPPIESALVHGKQITVYPSSRLTSEGPVEFVIPADSSDFTALNQTRLEGEITITKPNGDDFAAADKISIVNLFPQSIWKQIECSIGDVQINDLSTPTYPYKAFLESHLSLTDDVKTTSLKGCAYYVKDDPGNENSLVVADAGDVKHNKGFVKRGAFFKGNKLYFSIMLHIDFFQCPRLLIPGVEVKLKMIRSSDNFSILTDAVDFKINIHELVLKVRRITADPSILSRIETQLSSSPAIYPIVKSVIKTHLLQNGTANNRIGQMIRGKLPRSFILSFVTAKGYDGDKSVNPFVFNNQKNNFFQVYINGEPIIPTPFQPKYSTGKCVREYAWFLDNIGLNHTASNAITKEEFISNSCFYPFDLSPDKCNSIYLHGVEDGTVDIDVGFETAPNENLYCMMYASYDEIISIDKNRNVVIV